jgi:hypothetical protein
MKRLMVSWAAFAALATSSVVYAAPVTSASPLALESVDLGEAQAYAVSGDFAQPPPDETSLAAHRSGFIHESIRYRPRYRPRSRPRRPVYREERPSRGSGTFTQIHAGFMDPEGPERAGFLAGLRLGVAPDAHVQIGATVDWRHRENSQSQVVSESPGPGGTVITTRRDLARSSSDFIPFLGFVQVSGGPGLPVVPYFGAGAGYEVLHLTAEDFQTGEEFEGTFGGFGWQLWGGVSFPLSGSARFNAEVFANQAELSRDDEDPLTGESFRETVDMDGTGARFGFSWGF